MTELTKKFTVPEVSVLIKDYLQGHENGFYGNIKIFFEGNIDNSHITWLEQYCDEANDKQGVVICKILHTMSKTQRLKLSHVNCNLSTIGIQK